jgi:O-antigen ligase
MLLLFAPLCIYALMLTGSRTGLVGLVVIALGVIAKARHRFVLAIGFLLIGIIGFPLLSADFQDRYLSLVGLSVKNEATAELRVAGLEVDLEVALRRPIFGHGLGTSREARANFAGWDQPSHNLYAEAAVELGFVGMAIVILLVVSIISGLQNCRRAYASQKTGAFLSRVLDAMQVWLMLNIAFSLASYGLTSYEWYLLGGLAVVLQRFAIQDAAVPSYPPLKVDDDDQVRETRPLPAVQSERAP